MEDDLVSEMSHLPLCLRALSLVLLRRRLVPKLKDWCFGWYLRIDRGHRSGLYLRRVLSGPVWSFPTRK